MESPRFRLPRTKTLDPLDRKEPELRVPAIVTKGEAYPGRQEAPEDSAQHDQGHDPDPTDERLTRSHRLNQEKPQNDLGAKESGETCPHDRAIIQRDSGENDHSEAQGMSPIRFSQERGNVLCHAERASPVLGRRHGTQIILSGNPGNRLPLVRYPRSAARFAFSLSTCRSTYRPRKQGVEEYFSRRRTSTGALPLPLDNGLQSSQ